MSNAAAWLGARQPAEVLPRDTAVRDFGLRAELFSTQPPLHTEVELGPGAGLARAWRGPGAALVAGLARAATHRIAPVHYQQLWLGAVLA